MTIPLHLRVRELVSTLVLAGHHLNMGAMSDGAASLKIASAQLNALRAAVEPSVERPRRRRRKRK